MEDFAPLKVSSRSRPALAVAEWTAEPGLADVWQVDLARVPRSRLDVLSADESERAARMQSHRGGRAAAAFAPSRAALREILSLYVGAAPAAIEFAIGEHGRPRLAADFSGGLDFNVSHTGNLALVAVAVDRSVGVDIEAVDASREVLKLSKRFFTPAECARITSDSDQGRDQLAAVRAFSRLWTCKEAYLKALGTGFARSSRSFEVKLAASLGPALIEDGERAEGAGDVSLVELELDFELEPGRDAALAASLCIIGAAAGLRVFDAAELLR